MAEGEGPGINRTQIWVAVITVIGGLLTAIIINADKWIVRGEKPVVAASPATASPPPSGSAAPKSVAATPDSGEAGSTAATPPAVATVDIAGEWRDDDGSRFTFTQSGAQYEYTHTAINGTFQSAGKGMIAGRDLSHRFEMATGETGECTARVNAAVNKMTGNCVIPNGGWTFVIER